MKFREKFLHETIVDLFSCITIALACIKVFVTNFLLHHSLAIPSPDNYGCQRKNYSHACIQCLEWLSHTLEIQIQHAANDGETQIGRYFVEVFAVIDGVEYVREF